MKSNSQASVSGAPTMGLWGLTFLGAGMGDEWKCTRVGELPIGPGTAMGTAQGPKNGQRLGQKL